MSKDHIVLNLMFRDGRLLSEEERLRHENERLFRAIEAAYSEAAFAWGAVGVMGILLLAAVVYICWRAA